VFIAAAVSSIVRPPKKRSSTTWRFYGGRGAVNASPRRTTSAM
jgi:hypothetical protein